MRKPTIRVKTKHGKKITNISSFRNSDFRRTVWYRGRNIDHDLFEAAKQCLDNNDLGPLLGKLSSKQKLKLYSYLVDMNLAKLKEQ